MANIQYIKSSTNWATFNDMPGVWTQQIPAMPSVNPDMCIVRGVTFLGPIADEKTFLIWCSLTNDYIGSFNSNCIVSQTQGMQIVLNSPVPNSLTFQLHLIDPAANVLALDQHVFGNIAIQLEFIKYKDVPLHA